MTQSKHQMKPQVNSAGRVGFLDGVRGFASLLVLIGHSFEAAKLNATAWQSVLNFGRAGIVAFFVVSGYVVALSLAHQSVRVFWIRRFFRLYPVYWLALFVYLAVDWPASSGRYEFGFVAIVLNLLMIQGFVSAASMLWPSWTLGSELAFYGQQSFLKRYSGKFFSSLGWFWLFVFAAMCFVTRFTATDLTAVSPLMMFTASIGIAIYMRDVRGSKVFVPYVIAAVVVVPILGWVLQGNAEAFPSSEWSVVGFDVSYLAGLVIFAGFYLCRERSIHPVLLWLGSISYALYLVHAIVLRVLERLSFSGVWIPIVTIPVSLVLAWLMHKFVERPMIALGRRLSARAKVRVEASGV